MATIIIESGVTSNGLVLPFNSGSEVYAVADVYGTVVQTTVSSGGTLTLGSGGVATNTTVSSGGIMNVVSGAANKVDIRSGGRMTVTHGVASNVQLDVGAVVSTWTGGEFSLMAADAAVTLYKVDSWGGYGNGDLNDFTFSGNLRLDAGNYHRISAYRYLELASGAKLYDGVVDAATILLDGASATGLTINGDDTSVYSAVLSGATVNSGARLYAAHSGAEIRDVEIASGGTMFVASGAVVENTVVASGGRMNVTHGVASNVQLDVGALVSTWTGGEFSLMAANAAVTLYQVDSWGGYGNGTLSDFTFSGNLRLDVGNYHRISAYRRLELASGATAEVTTVNSGGSMTVFDGGAAIGTIVSNDGVMTVFSGGEAAETTVNSHGSMFISSGAVAENTVVASGGRITVYRDGVMTGRLEIASGANVTMNNGTLDFAAAAQTTSGAALINDWSRIVDNGANVTITVASDQASGEYALAAGATDFAKTVTVKTAEAELGTLAVGETIVCGDTSYTLNKADGLLSLTVIAPEPPPTATGAEVILTITDPNHDYYGATGGWKILNDQTAAWQDLTTLGEGYSYLGLGTTAAGKAMPDVYVYNAGTKSVGAYVTDDIGAVAGFESIFSCESALMQVGLADFNADGVSDLLLRTADGFVRYYANGAFADVQELGLEWQVAALGDVDGNGRADVIIAHEAGYVGAYLIGTDGSISWADLGNLDNSTAIVGAGDVNGDGTDDVIVQVGTNYFGAWLCGNGAVTGFFGIDTFDAEVQDIADYNADGTDDLLLRTAGGVVGAALITAADTTAWAEYGALGDEWSTKGVGIL